MSENQEKKPSAAGYWRETFFLPPLNMFLTFLDRETQAEKQEPEPQEKAREKDVEKLIEKLSEEEE